jgi:hypothetical protein
MWYLTFSRWYLLMYSEMMPCGLVNIHQLFEGLLLPPLAMKMKIFDRFLFT